MSDWRNLAACKGKTEIFFPDGEYIGTSLLAAREVCAGCPVYEECRAWGDSHFNECDDGILYGYTAVERRIFQTNRLAYVDWRFTDWEHPVSSKQVAAREREARRRGEPAVVNAYRYFEIEDPEERRRVVEAYQAWQLEAQSIPLSYEQAEERARRHAARLTKIHSTRPECPNGCEQVNVARLRKNAAGEQVWQCYRCRAKIIMSAAEDAELRRGA